VGGGRAATLHAEATRAAGGCELVGVGGRPGSATALAAALDVPDLSLNEFTKQADGLVLAIPAPAAATVITALPSGFPILVESPVPPGVDAGHRAVAAVNLLHATAVKKALRAIADLGPVHHLTLRGRATRRDGAVNIFAEPFAGAWPVLLAAAGTPASSISATRTESSATASIDLADGRRLTATLEWVDPGEASLTEIEAASQSGVVNCALWPVPVLEIDGRSQTSPDDHPLVSLGFVEQIRRFATVCSGHSEPWPALAVGLGVTALADAAERSAARAGDPVEV